ncbi:hypothetical protein G7054_g14515 [Neopestalotiopsis clavispora]|nr:hypothetical protein G7054_g14515 [Neopestalotiopsis clavispora]
MLYDLNLAWSPSTSAAELTRTLKFSANLGYNVVALNHTLSLPVPGQITNPLPKFDKKKTAVSSVSDDDDKLPTVLTRCTVPVSDTSVGHHVPRLVNAYDIVALRPTTDKGFQAACQNIDNAHIISLDMTQFLNYHFKPTTVMAAVRRGMRFEICYAQALSADARGRAAFIGNVMQLARATVLFSSSKSATALFASPLAAVLLELSRRLKTFSALLSETRTFLRLWGLLGMYFWARGLFIRLREARRAAANDEKGAASAAAKVDKLEVSLAVSQLVACVIFQGLENGAYLAQKSVLVWQPATIGSAYRWSARFWGAFVGLKLTELFLDRYRRASVPKRQRMGDKTVAVFEREEAEWSAEWRKLVSRNMAWFPLTLHWSLEQGLFNELTIGALASVPGCIQMRDLWRRTSE